MEKNRKIVLVVAITTFILPIVLLCSASSASEKKDKQDIWRESESGEPRQGSRLGQKRFEPTEEEIDRIMTSLKQSNPEKAKELAELRKKEPERFKAELRKYGREEYAKIIKERIEDWRNKRRAEFIEWLEKNYSKVAKELATLKEKQPGIYWEKFDQVRKKYWPIFEEEKRNPELAEVLKEDLELTKRRDELVRKIKSAKNEKEKEKFAAHLEEVVGRRFDLIIRKKQIEYERLLKRIEQLQKQVKESRNEIGKWMNTEFKTENVKKRLKDLTEEIPQLKWD